jgi:hypothetical protein
VEPPAASVILLALGCFAAALLIPAGPFIGTGTPRLIWLGVAVLFVGLGIGFLRRMRVAWFAAGLLLVLLTLAAWTYVVGNDRRPGGWMLLAFCQAALLLLVPTYRQARSSKTQAAVPRESSRRPPRFSPLVHAVLLVLATNAALFASAQTVAVLRRRFTGNLGERASRMRVFSSKSCSVPLPANWRIQTEDRSYDPDRYLVLDAPGDAIVAIGIREVEEDTSQAAKELWGIARDFLSKPERIDVRKWGRYEGLGYVVTGLRKDGTPLSITVFAFNAEGRSYRIKVSTSAREPETTFRDLRLIEESFKAQPRGTEEEERIRRRAA